MVIFFLDFFYLFLNHFKVSVGYLHKKKNKNSFHLRFNKRSLVVHFFNYWKSYVPFNLYGYGFNTEMGYATERAPQLHGAKASGVLIYHSTEPQEKLSQEKGMAWTLNSTPFTSVNSRSGQGKEKTIIYILSQSQTRDRTFWTEEKGKSKKRKLNKKNRLSTLVK